jgi:hypothetical protein
MRNLHFSFRARIRAGGSRFSGAPPFFRIFPRWNYVTIAAEKAQRMRITLSRMRKTAARAALLSRVVLQHRRAARLVSA